MTPGEIDEVSGYRTTGHVGAWTALEVLEGRVPRGVHHAADVLDPEPAVAAW